MTWQSCFGIEGNVRDALVDLIQLVNLEDGFLDRLGEATDLEDEKLQARVGGDVGVQTRGSHDKACS